MNEILLKRIKELCEEKSISQRKLQLDLNLSAGSISKWRTSTPSSDTIQKTADYFNVTTDYLCGKSDFKNLDHMLEYWNKKHIKDGSVPDLMLPDGSIIEFMQSNEGMTYKRVMPTDDDVKVEYNSVDQQLLNTITSNRNLRELVEMIIELPDSYRNMIYTMVKEFQKNM